MANNRNDNNGEPQPHVANGNQNNSVDGHCTNVTETEGSFDPTYNPNAPEKPYSDGGNDGNTDTRYQPARNEHPRAKPQD
jgi:hypothetical protein